MNRPLLEHLAEIQQHLCQLAGRIQPVCPRSVVPLLVSCQLELQTQILNVQIVGTFELLIRALLLAVHRRQTRQPVHDAVSTTASNARTCSASHPRPTSRLRPFCNRISTRESPAAFGAASVSCTSRNFTAVSSRNRFFHAKKYGLHRLRSRQNAVTVCPLRACSEISLRHFVRAFFPRLVMSQPCTATRSFTRWGSHNAHDQWVVRLSP